MMRVVVAVIALSFLGGCGSCFEDKKVPEEQPVPKSKTIFIHTEAGTRRPIEVGQPPSFTEIMNRLDGGRHDGGH